MVLLSFAPSPGLQGVPGVACGYSFCTVKEKWDLFSLYLQSWGLPLSRQPPITGRMRLAALRTSFSVASHGTHKTRKSSSSLWTEKFS